MAGGDMHVRAGAAFGAPVRKAEVIDAHSVKAGDFTEPRTVDGKNVFLTASGAEAWDKILSEGGYRVTASEDPGAIMSFITPKSQLEPETHQGNPKAKAK